MEKKMTNEFKGKILGIMYDGYSLQGFIDYVACFIVYEGIDGSCVSRLIAVTSLPPVNLKSDTHFDFISSALQRYGLKVNDISFLVGDNCGLNISLSKKMQIPLIGCALHRFKFAMDDFYKDYEIILRKVNEIMKTLSCGIYIHKLLKIIPLKPQTRNDYFSSTTLMIARFIKFHDEGILNEFKELEPSLIELMPTPSEIQQLRVMSSNLG
jgi:hypothetical protein